MKSTQNYSESIRRLRAALDNADAVLIGAGAGLSASAGFAYSGKRFRDNFSDFEKSYGFTDMYAGGFYPYDTLEEYWAYWSRYILVNRYSDPPKPVYDRLYELISAKDHFVLTTNVDHCFQKARFDKRRLFYTQGDYGLFQCSVPCHDKTYDNEMLVKRMATEQKNMRIPTELIPRCPVCGRPMTMNLRIDDTFVQDNGWNAACARYDAFVNEHKRDKLLLLELGVGGNTPVIIKYPFWQFTMNNENAVYACINKGEAFCPTQIRDRSICINGDICDTIEALLECEQIVT